MVDSIQKTHEYFKITGKAPFNNEVNPPPPSQYLIESIQPVSCEVTSVWHPTGQENKVSSSASSLEVKAQDGSCSTFTGAEATAETRYDFKPTVYSIALSLKGHVDMHAFENSLMFNLSKIDDNSIVASKTWKTEESQGYNIGEQVSCSVVPGSEYRITLKAIVICGDSPGARSNLKVTIVDN